MRNPTDEQRELLPCPFCGSKAHQHYDFVSCSDCGISTVTSTAEHSAAEWNARVEVLADAHARGHAAGRAERDAEIQACSGDLSSANYARVLDLIDNPPPAPTWLRDAVRRFQAAINPPPKYTDAHAAGRAEMAGEVRVLLAEAIRRGDSTRSVRGKPLPSHRRQIHDLLSKLPPEQVREVGPKQADRQAVADGPRVPVFESEVDK